ncbi:MAG: cyclic nucleotide-binding domain-containing protein [Alphaproteobacteria bacterium]|nr:cyclic nucleotide-binding domain-containing protein [Alphaproteobacteria bacterium]
MVDHFQAKTFVAGETLLREGDPGGVAYMVEHGRVEVSKAVGGRKVVLNILGPGAIVGEMALIDKAPRMATVTALDKTVALVIDRRVFDKILADAPPVLRALVLAYTAHLRNLGSRASRLETDLHDAHSSKPGT